MGVVWRLRGRVVQGSDSDRQTDRQADQQTDGQTYIPPDRQTDRQGERPHRVTSGLFTGSNPTQGEYNTKRAQYTNAKHISRIRKLVPSVLLLYKNKLQLNVGDAGTIDRFDLVLQCRIKKKNYTKECTKNNCKLKILYKCIKAIYNTSAAWQHRLHIPPTKICLTFDFQSRSSKPRSSTTVPSGESCPLTSSTLPQSATKGTLSR